MCQLSLYLAIACIFRSLHVPSIESWLTFSTLSSFVSFQNIVPNHLPSQCNLCLAEIHFYGVFLEFNGHDKKVMNGIGGGSSRL